MENEFDPTVPLAVKKLTQRDADRILLNAPTSGAFKGKAILSTNPGVPTVPNNYIASVKGTYTYFLDSLGFPLIVTDSDGFVTFDFLPSEGFWTKTNTPIESTPGPLGPLGPIGPRGFTGADGNSLSGASISEVSDFITKDETFGAAITCRNKERTGGNVFVNRPADSGLTANNGTIYQGANGTFWEMQFTGDVYISWFGAKHNEDHTTAIQLCLDLYRGVVISEGTHLLSAPLLITTTSKIQGLGYLAILKTTGNFNAVELNGNEIHLDGLNIAGTGKDGTNSDQNGIYWNQRVRNQITNCRFENLNGAGIKGDETVQGFDGNNITGCIAFGCNIGYNFMNRCEYNQLVNCSALSGNTGVLIVGGNNSVVGCNISNNATGIDIQAGDNDGHGVITGTKINHNLSYAIKFGAVTSYTISSNMMFYGAIYLTGSNHVRFFNNEIYSPVDLNCVGAIDCLFEQNRFVLDTNVVQDSASRVFFKNNTVEELGALGDKSWNIKGGLEQRFVTGSINIASADTPYTIPFASFSARFISKNLTYGFDEFFNATTNRFVNKGYNGGEILLSGKIRVQYPTFANANGNLALRMDIYSDATGSTLQDSFNFSPTFYGGEAIFDLTRQFPIGLNSAFSIVLLSTCADTVTVLGAGNSIITVEGL